MTREDDNIRNSYLAIKATQRQSCEDEDVEKAFQLGLAFGRDEAERRIKMCNIWPLTIISDRYDGVYSGGKWTAWNMNHWDISDMVSGDDMDCPDFFSTPNLIYGRGETPEEAIDDLKFMLDHGVHMPNKKEVK